MNIFAHSTSSMHLKTVVFTSSLNLGAGAVKKESGSGQTLSLGTSSSDKSRDLTMYGNAAELWQIFGDCQRPPSLLEKDLIIHLPGPALLMSHC